MTIRDVKLYELKIWISKYCTIFTWFACRCMSIFYNQGLVHFIQRCRYILRQRWIRNFFKKERKAMTRNGKFTRQKQNTNFSVGCSAISQKCLLSPYLTSNPRAAIITKYYLRIISYFEVISIFLSLNE